MRNPTREYFSAKKSHIHFSMGLALILLGGSLGFLFESPDILPRLTLPFGLVFAILAGTWVYATAVINWAINLAVNYEDQADRKIQECKTMESTVRRLEGMLTQMAVSRCYGEGGTDDHNVATICARQTKGGDAFHSPSEAFVLITLNNEAGWLNEDEFAYLCGMLTSLAERAGGHKQKFHSVICMRRNVAPVVLTGVNNKRYEELADWKGEDRKSE